MALAPGSRIGPYEIVSPLGKGGMGEVYRAREARLKRDVAIKLLPDAVAADPERLARFEREAQLLAALQHPHIATIYGIEESAGARCIVMELVEGETLLARLQRGSVPAAEAMTIARQIAEGLEAAHERGIIHRDLKPANVVVAGDGTVKILDFGLAKAFDDPVSGARADVSLSPTVTAASTRAGVLLGTAAYMSPEQARGAAVDRRSDIWAFGCVLLEMLTGRSTFAEDTISDTLASILKSEPSWEGLASDTPPRLRQLLKRCLQKNPRLRLRDIGEARIALDEILAGNTGADESPRPAAASAPARRPWPWMLVAGVAVLAAVVLALWRPAAPASTPAQAVHRFEIQPKELVVNETFPPMLSPDGTKVLFRAQDKLWIRRLDQIEPMPLAGSEGADHAVWSPDSDELAFMTAGELWRMSIAGGDRATVARGVGQFTPSGRLTWGMRDRIVYSEGSSGLLEVPARGGDTKPLLDVDPNLEFDIHDPASLPDGRGYIGVSHRLDSNVADAIFAFAGGQRHELLRLRGQLLRRPVWSPTGHIFFRRETGNAGLWAVPVSLDRMEATGEPTPIDAEGDFPSVASNGTLLYSRGSSQGNDEMVWVTLEGKIEGTLGLRQRQIRKLAISPDGARVAVMGLDGDNWDIWVHDVSGATRTRLTFNPAQDWDPVWLPDGSTVIFWEGNTRVLSRVRADGSGAVERVVPEDFPDSGDPTISRDGRMLLFWVKLPASPGDLWYMPLAGERKSIPLVTSPPIERYPSFSPDGRSFAYVSNETSREEVYIKRFPDGEGKWQVSTQGGFDPRWNSRGDRLYFMSADAVMEVEVSTQPAVRTGTPRVLFHAREIGVRLDGDTHFDIAPDGRRFAMVRPIPTEGAGPRLVLVEGWRP